MFMPYRNAPKFSLNRPRLSFSSCRCMKLASKSAMLSLSSANAGSSVARGKSALETDALPLGVVCDARRLVREGGRKGVVGRDGTRVLEWLELRRLPDECGCSAGVAVDAIVMCRTLTDRCTGWDQVNRRNWTTRSSNVSRFDDPARPHFVTLQPSRRGTRSRHVRMNAMPSQPG